MKIQAYMPVFGEADILPHTLRHLHEQGCAVHVLDGWSTDGSWNVMDRREFKGVTSERFPASGPDPIQNCTAILKRIEDLAAESDADWILYTDADEWRRTPNELFAPDGSHWFSDEHRRLQDTAALVDEFGCNAIDFRVFQFYPTTDTVSWSAWQRDGPEASFHYYDQSDCISRIPNRKLWKNVDRVQLAGGGHEVTFPGMRVYPQKFVMKHYPFRTPAQAKAKIETRLARRRKEEHDKGWGVHYDQYPPDFNFCWDPAKLKFWKDTRSPLP